MRTRERIDRLITRFQRSMILIPVDPGPLTQAFTLRAFWRLSADPHNVFVMRSALLLASRLSPVHASPRDPRLLAQPNNYLQTADAND